MIHQSQIIEIIDTTLPERWIAQGGSTTYSFADVATDIYWDLYDADYNLVDTGYGASFMVGTGLASGDYEVWAYFPSLYGNNATYAPFHVVQVDIEQEVTNIAWTATSATLNLTPDSYFGGGDVVWTVTPPPGLSVTSSNNTSFTFSPTNSTPGEYVVTAQSQDLTTCQDTCIVRIIQVELDVDANYDGVIEDADEPLEESVGVFTATNVLCRIDLAVLPGPNTLTSGGMILSAVAGGDKIKVWADPNKTTEVTLDKAWSIASFPDKLYVEGIKASDSVRDIQLRLCYTNKTFSCCDEIKLTSVKVDLAEDPSQNYGFDPDGPWISVEKSKTTTVKVNIGPSSAASQVYFTSSDASKVTVQPSHASGSPQTLTLTAGSIEDDGATVDVRLGNASGLVCEQLGVAVYEKKSIQCFVHKVNGYAGSISLSEVNNLLKQAVVRIDSYAEDTRSCDLSAGYPYDVDNAEDEHVDLANTGLSPGWADVFFIPSPGKVRTVGGEIRLGMHYHYEFGDVHWNILSETADPFSRYLAHELFHYWQESHESDNENLMHSDVSGEHLKKTQWDLAH